MSIILTLLNQILPTGLWISHRKCIQSLIRAILLSLSINLLKVSRAMNNGVKTLSNVRKIQRLLGLNLFSCTTMGLAIVKMLPKANKYILTLDRTAWELGKRDYNILAIGICYDGISIPIYFDTYDKDGTSDFTEEIAFMEHVLDLIPVEKIECLVADREFGNGNFIRWLSIRHIPYCLRLRENFNIKVADTKQKIQLRHKLSSLALGDSVILADTYIVARKVRVRIFATRRKGRRKGEEELLILATPVESNFTDKIYRLRWQIEVTFRALKSIGFNIEDSHLSTDGNFQNMLKYVFIAYAAAFIDGLIRIKSNPIPIMKKVNRKRFSIFTWGLDEVVRLIWANVKFEPLISP